MQNLFLIILTTICLLSCTSSKENNSIQYTKSLMESKKITLPIDENTYYLSLSIFQFEEENKEYLLFGNFEKKQHEILIYDIENQNLHKRIPLEKEGPNGIPSICGSIPFVDSNTFLISQHNAGRVTIADGEGNVVRYYNMRQSGKRNALWADCRFGISFFYAPSFTKDSIVYFSNLFFVRERLNHDDWKTLPMFNSLNLRNGHVGTLPINYPDIIEDDVKIPAGGAYNFKSD